jgi:uncharacterized membrane protein YfcA
MEPEVVKEFAILSLVALLIGVSKAGFGGGTGILVGPFLALLFPAKESVALMLPLLFACDIASLYPYWGKWDDRNVLVIMPGALLGIVLGGFALGKMSDEILKKTIGGLAIAFALLQIYRDWIVRSDKALVPNWWHGSAIGLGTGFVSTLSHVGGALTTMYLLPQKLDNERFVGTTTALYFLINVAKIPVYMSQDMLTTEVFTKDLPLFPVIFLGTALGVWLNRRVPSKWFSRVVLMVVFITGFHLLFKD